MRILCRHHRVIISCTPNSALMVEAYILGLRIGVSDEWGWFIQGL